MCGHENGREDEEYDCSVFWKCFGCKYLYILLDEHTPTPKCSHVFLL